MAYKFQVGSSKLSGSITLTNVLSSSAALSASYFFGNGSELTGITADSFEVDDTNANTEFKLVGVENTGTGVTLVAMDDGNFPAYNASTGKLTVKGALDIDGATTMASISGSTITAGDYVSGSTLQASQRIIIGSADITESELEQIDGITAGTVAASKAVVVDSSKDIAGFGAISGSSVIGASYVSASALRASERIVIGSADITESELEMIDGITAGTIAADKAVVVDDHKDVSSFRDVTGSALRFDGGESKFLAADFGGGYGSTGVTISEAGVIQADGALQIASTANFDGTMTCDTSITIDSTTITAAEIGVLDSVTAGTAAASKAVVLNSAADLTTGLRDVTGSALKLNDLLYTNRLTCSAGLLASENVQVADNMGVVFLGDGSLNFKSATTGNSGLALTDNLASAFYVHQAGTSYLKFVTSNGEEGVQVEKDLVIGSGVATGDEPVLELYGAQSFVGQYTVQKNVDLGDIMYSHYLMNGTGSTKLTVTLPAAETGYAATFKRHPSMTASCGIVGNAGENIDGSANELLLETAGASVTLVASGSAWYIY
tara:strand:- start:1973 stop:3625 length:1653 start_codon:yes stop_codon:yes gene_type:complete